MDIYTAIEYICSIDEELEAISVLLNSHRKKHEQNFKDLCDREASLKAICKLNMAKYKDEAIDALSDVNNYEISNRKENDYGRCKKLSALFGLSKAVQAADQRRPHPLHE